MAKFAKIFLVLFVVVIFGCGTQDGSDGGSDGPSSGDSQTVTSLSLQSDVESILSDGVSEATLTVRALDSQNVAVDGAVITLSSTGGALSDSSVITDADGYATFFLDSGFVTSQQAVTITASSGSVVATETVNILGTTVSFSSDKSSVGLNGATTATVTATVRNGSGAPVEGVSITLDSDLGTLNGSQAEIELVTNSSGQVSATFAGESTSGAATISLEGPDSQTLTILISDSQFTLNDSEGGFVNVSSNDRLTLTWIDSSGAPVVGETVSFSATMGTFDASGNNFIEVVTDSSGQASTTFYPDTVGTDTISVQSVSGGLSDNLSLTIIAENPASISLNVNPSVVSRSINGNTSTATVSATVLDSNNRAVQGEVVGFRITGGPGGGESLSSGQATTNAAGIASVTFTSGGQISAQDGVSIVATVVSNSTLTDTATLTIADQAATVIIGETNKIITLTIGDAEAAYALPFTVLVTDTNGGPIANQQVSLSVFPTFFRTGYFADGDDYTTRIELNEYPNEDVNRNGNLDFGEDSVFPNGRLDPGGVVSIVSSVTTDENGFAGFNLVYPKNYGTWVDVEITATTSVSGSESKALIETTLAVEDGDTPYPNSPFGQ